MLPVQGGGFDATRHLPCRDTHALTNPGLSRKAAGVDGARQACAIDARSKRATPRQSLDRFGRGAFHWGRVPQAPPTSPQIPWSSPVGQFPAATIRGRFVLSPPKRFPVRPRVLIQQRPGSRVERNPPGIMYLFPSRALFVGWRFGQGRDRQRLTASFARQLVRCAAPCLGRNNPVVIAQTVQRDPDSLWFDADTVCQLCQNPPIDAVAVGSCEIAKYRDQQGPDARRFESDQGVNQGL